MIIIDPGTRQFNIPGAELTFGVESDAGSERKRFQCPRYVGNNLDLASCFVRMNFRNANGELDSYLVDDVTVDGDNVVFSWVLSQKATKYKGQLKFVVCAVGPNQKVEWHTTLGTGIVLEGLEPDAAVVEAGTADVVAQLIAMVEQQIAAVESEGATQIKAVQAAAQDAQAVAVAQIEAKGVNTRESIPEDYTALSEAVDSVVRGKAPAIVCSEEGSAIAVNDASDMPIQGMRFFGRSTQDGVPSPTAPVEIKSVVEPVVTVAGKNLLDVVGLENYNAEDGRIHTPYSSYYALTNRFGLVPVVPGETYTFSYKFSGGDRAIVELCDSTGSSLGDVGLGWGTYSAGYGGMYGEVGSGATFTIPKNNEIFYTRISLCCMPDCGEGNYNVYSEIQLEVGSKATAYEQYKAPQTLELTHTLPGIPVASGGNYTDSDGQQWICDEVDLERGVYVQRIKTDTVTISSRGVLDNGLSAGIYKAPDKLRLLAAGAICDRAKFVGVSGSAKNPNCFYENLNNFGFTGVETDTLEMLQAAYDGATITYILATPTETALSETEIAAYRALHSNYPNTTVLNDAGAHMVVKYAADTKLYIDNKIAALIGG